MERGGFLIFIVSSEDRLANAAKKHPPADVRAPRLGSAAINERVQIVFWVFVLKTSFPSRPKLIEDGISRLWR
jgi:hypothetical protein